MLQIFHHPNSLKHDMGEQHLEAPIRIKIIQDRLKNAKYKTKFVEAVAATEDDITSVHALDLLRSIEESSERTETYFTLDTIANQYTYSAAMTAAGGALQVANKIKDKSIQFGMLRPPGHHSTFDTAMGFCFFNNIAITTQKLLDSGYDKIAILDVDHHHGNGTQDLFYGHPNVLYTSLHADPKIAFPGTGFIGDDGFGDGLGKTVNIPLPLQTKDADYLAGFDEVITPIVDQFKPDAILVSLGLDALDNDPYGVLCLSPTGYYEIGRRIGALTNKLCKNQIGVMLEGGYNYDEIGIATDLFFEGVLNYKDEPRINPQVTYRFDQVLRQVKSVQRNHWFDI